MNSSWNSKIVEKRTHNLSPLQTSDTVAIQSPLNHQWNTTGKVIAALPNCQYQIRVDGLGRITLRNHCFLRKCKFKTAPKPIPFATPAAITPTINTSLLHPDPLTSSSNDTPKQTTHTLTHPQSSKIPRALSKLLPYNRPRLKERHSPHTTQPTCGGRGRWRSYCPNTQEKIILTSLAAQLTSANKQMPMSGLV